MERSERAEDAMVPFQTPDRFLAAMDAGTTGRIIASGSDVALVIEGGVVRDVALSSSDLLEEERDRAWIGQPWVDTVTVESRPKIEGMLALGRADPPCRRQVNHPSRNGLDLPIQYTAVHAGTDDRLIAFGRDLRTTARIQQRLVEAHQELERDYARLREAESRYRLLFQSVSLPVLIVEPTAGEIHEANPAAANAVGEPVPGLIGSPLEGCFDRRAAAAVKRLLAEATSLGSASVSSLRLARGGTCDVTASAFRQDQATRLIVRLEMVDGAAMAVGSGGEVARILQDLPDGLVVVGADLTILAANPAFVEMTHTVHRGQVVGGRLSEFLGRSSTELNVLTSSLKNHGVVRNFATVLRDRFGNEEPVEVSAATTPVNEEPIHGLSIRTVARRLESAPPLGEGMPGQSERLAGLVGRVPLKEIVRESTDFIEKLCIEAALEVTGDNRASAAEMLGLSRQGLYSKLKRFGIGD